MIFSYKQSMTALNIFLLFWNNSKSWIKTNNNCINRQKILVHSRGCSAYPPSCTLWRQSPRNAGMKKYLESLKNIYIRICSGCFQGRPIVGEIRRLVGLTGFVWSVQVPEHCNHDVTIKQGWWKQRCNKNKQKPWLPTFCASSWGRQPHRSQIWIIRVVLMFVMVMVMLTVMVMVTVMVMNQSDDDVYGDGDDDCDCDDDGH